MRFKSEAQFRRTLIQALRKESVFVQAIESSLTGNGIPDLFIVYRGMSAWIELKNNEVNWRPGQIAWLTRLNKNGGLGVLLLASLNGVTLFMGDDIKEKYTQEEVDEATIPRLDAQVILETIRGYYAQRSYFMRVDDNNSPSTPS